MLIFLLIIIVCLHYMGKANDFELLYYNAMYFRRTYILFTRTQ